MKEKLTLNNGVHMPMVGFGTGSLKDKDAYDSVLYAIKIGYRHIDTAAIYENEVQVGKAVMDSGILRSELFITSKVPVNVKTYEETLKAFDLSIANLNTSYLDLYLIHAPWSWDYPDSDLDEENKEVYRALETLYVQDKIRAIGVSNFLPKHLDNILNSCVIKPQINQIKWFIGKNQDDIVAYCRNKKIAIEAYSPLGNGGILKDPTIQKIAQKYHVSPATLCLSYLSSQHAVVIPRSKIKREIKENLKSKVNINANDMHRLHLLKIEA